MAFDAFIKIKDVKGESTDAAHKDEIEVLSYSWGVMQPAVATASSSGAISGERANFSDLSIVKLADIASAPLAQHCITGKHIPEAVLTLSRAQEKKVEYMRYVLEDIIVSSVRHGGSGSGSDPVFTEEVTFNYGKISFFYTKSDKTGAKVGNYTGGWSLIENKVYLSSNSPK
jgi:type VI secretion system secreted protein Hcp